MFEKSETPKKTFLFIQLKWKGKSFKKKKKYLAIILFKKIFIDNPFVIC